MENYVLLSLENHLYFARIMKEHALFLMAGFPCKNESWIRKADKFREEFEDLLRDVVKISNHQVTPCVLNSNELTTEFTLPAEERTSNLCGVSIDTRITCDTKELHPRKNNDVNRGMNCCKNRNMNNYMNCNMNRNRICPEKQRLIEQTEAINERALELVNGLIEFKECILNEVSKGKIFNANYPLLIKHIIREAKLYRDNIKNLQNKEKCNCRNMRDTELFWNQIMMEHALFIRGLLDPSECQLIESADNFAKDYKKLLKEVGDKDFKDCESLTRRTLSKTMEYRDFKSAGTDGILNCKIDSIILPLLADHVLREANHYIRLLKQNISNEN